AVHVVLLACSHSRCSISDVRLCSVVNLGATTVIYSLSLHDALPCLTRSPRSGREPPLSSCVPRRLQPRGTGPQRRHPDQRQTGSTAPDCHRPIRTIWVYKGTPNPPVKPSGVLNRGIVFNPSWVADPRAKRLSRESPILAEAGRGELEVTRVSVSRDCRRVGSGGMGAFDCFGHFVLPPGRDRGEPGSEFDQSVHPAPRHP